MLHAYGCICVAPILGLAMSWWLSVSFLCISFHSLNHICICMCSPNRLSQPTPLMHAYMCVCCTYIRAHGRLVSVLMTYLNAALTLMMLLLIHIDQVHNTLCWWFVINKTCFLHFSFLNLHLGVFSVPFRDAFCETGRADYKPRCSDRRLYLTSLSLSYFQLPCKYLRMMVILNVCG